MTLADQYADGAIKLQQRAAEIVERAQRRWWWPRLTLGEKQRVTSLLTVSGGYLDLADGFRRQGI